MLKYFFISYVEDNTTYCLFIEKMKFLNLSQGNMDKETNYRKKTQIRKEFGIKVRMLRLTQKLTQEQLAERANLHPTYIGAIERGERNISLENILAVAKGLGCSIKDLFD